jgi:prepilin peptidase CpaA
MTFPHVIAVAIAVTACITDLRSRQIPNLLTFGGALTALVFHTTHAGRGGLLISVSGSGLAVILFLLPFALGGLGGGDLKLLAALGAWIGPALTIWMALYTGAAGGVLALVVALARGYLGQALANIRLLLTHRNVAAVRTVNAASRADSHGPGLAYAPPIFVGMVIALWLHS